jgi:anti-sigma regulatory factor (Ser/Thr protein kinase)
MRAMPGFSHEAFFYAGDDAYLAGIVPFIDEGIEAGESVLVAVPGDRLRLLTRRFGDGHPQLRFADMEVLGRNPAWIIPAWAAFVAAQDAGRPARGVGQPIWASRSADELVECSRHEALINVAFADADGFRLLCPYDTTSLDHGVIEESLHNHPHVTSPDAIVLSDAYTGAIPSWLESPLSPVPATADVLTFHAGDLARVRHRTAALATAAGLPPSRIDDLVMAVSEAITNSALHAGGAGEIALWQDGGRFLCEIRDQGAVSDPLAGRVRPATDQIGGRGLWLIHQLCDLVQMRRLPDGQAIRLHMHGGIR